MLDYNDPYILKQILMSRRRIEAEAEQGNNEAMLLLIDIDNLLSETTLTKQEQRVLNEIDKEYTLRELEEGLDIHYSNINRTINNICNKMTTKGAICTHRL